MRQARRGSAPHFARQTVAWLPGARKISHRGRWCDRWCSGSVLRFLNLIPTTGHAAIQTALVKGLVGACVAVPAAQSDHRLLSAFRFITLALFGGRPGFVVYVSHCWPTGGNCQRYHDENNHGRSHGERAPQLTYLGFSNPEVPVTCPQGRGLPHPDLGPVAMLLQLALAQFSSFVRLLSERCDVEHAQPRAGVVRLVPL